MGSCILIFLVLCLPETLRQRKALVPPVVEENTVPSENDKTGQPTLSRTTTMQSVHVQSRKYLIVLRRCFVDPLRILLYLQFPAVALCVFVSLCATKREMIHTDNSLVRYHHLHGPLRA